MNRETLLNAVLAFLLLALPFLALALDEPFYIDLATRVAVLGLAATGLNLALGVGGLVSFGHAAFFGIGGYVAGVMATHAFNAEPLFTTPFTLSASDLLPAIWIAAIAFGALLALPIGAISLRTSGVYFIMITLAFAQMVYYFAISWPAYGGEDGLALSVRNTLPGLDTADSLTFFLICYAMLMAGLAAFAVLRNSRFGAALETAWQNEVRLAALGVAPFRVRLVAFALSAGITSLAGALYADLNKFVSPSMLSWHMSGVLIVLVILGGVRRLFGPLAGAMLYIVLEFALGGLTERWQLFFGLILLGVVLFARGGLVGVLAGRPRHG